MIARAGICCKIASQAVHGARPSCLQGVAGDVVMVVVAVLDVGLHSRRPQTSAAAQAYTNNDHVESISSSPEVPSFLNKRSFSAFPRLLAAEPPECRFRPDFEVFFSSSAARWGLNSSPARHHPEPVSVCPASCVFANGRAIPFARRSTCDDSSRVKALRGICLPKQGRARARAGEDRTIAWTKLAHPRALSRPTMPCPCPLFCSISANGACTDEHEANTGPPFGCRAGVVHRYLVCYQRRNNCCVVRPSVRGSEPTADCLQAR